MATSDARGRDNGYATADATTDNETADANVFNAGHVINPQSYMQQQFQQQQQQRQQNPMEAMVPMMAEMIQQALASAGIGNRSTMAGPNGMVVQAPTEQAPTEQAPMRNNTNAYLPHGQEDPAFLLSDLHGDIDMKKKKKVILEILEIMKSTSACPVQFSALIMDSWSWTCRLLLPQIFLLLEASI